MSAKSATLDIKSTALDLLTIHLRSTDFASFETAFLSKLNGRAHTFSFEPVILSLETEHLDGLELGKIRELLARFGLNAISLKHANPAAAELAQAAGMNWIEAHNDSKHQTPKPAPNPKTTAENTNNTPEISENTENTETTANPELPADKNEPAKAAEVAETRFIHHPIRTGQQIYARGDLVILATVNPGAEVIADGNIHIYAPLKGRAIAGAHGNTKARIFTRSMEAELVSIAGMYRMFESAKTPFLGKHTQIYLKDNKIVVAAIDAEHSQKKSQKNQ